MPIRKISGITSSLVTVAKTRSTQAATKATVTQNNLLARAQTNIVINKLAAQQTRLVTAVNIDAEGLIRQFRDYQYMRDRMGLLINKVFADDVTMLDLIGVADGAEFDFNLFEPEFINILDEFVRVIQVYRSLQDTAVIISRPSLGYTTPRADNFFITDAVSNEPNKRFFEEILQADRETHIVDFRRVFEEYPEILESIFTTTETRRQFDDIQNLFDDQTLDVDKALFDLQLVLDHLQSLDVDKALFDDINLQSRTVFDITKFFADEFSVPDLIGVADGAIFELDLAEADNVLLTERSVFDVTQSKFDQVLALEDIALTRTFVRAGDGYTDAVTMLEQKSLGIGLGGALFDFGVDLSDVDVRDIVLGKFELVDFTELVAKYSAMLKQDAALVLDRPYLNYALATIADSIELTDVILAIILVSVAAFDEFFVTDAAPVFDISKGLRDQPLILEYLARQATFVRTGTPFVDDVFALEQKSLRPDLGKFDVQTFADDETLLPGLGKSDSIVSLEQITNKDITNLRSDVVQALERIFKEFDKTVSADLFELADSALPFFIRGKLPADTVTLTDRRPVFAIIKGLSDSTTMVDNSQVFDGLLYQLLIQKTENVDIADRPFKLISQRKLDEVLLGSQRQYNANQFLYSEDLTNAAWTEVAATTVNNGGNLLLYSEQFDNAAWVKTLGGTNPPTFFTNGGGTPYNNNLQSDGFIVPTISGSQSTFNGLTQQLTNKLAVGTTYTFSFWHYHTDTGGNQFDIAVHAGTATGTTAATTTVTATANTWTRWQLTFVANSSTMTVATRDLTTTNDAFNKYFWGAQLNTGSTATVYTPTTNIPVGQLTSPFGNTPVSFLQEDATTSLHYTVPTGIIPANRTSIVSVYAKSSYSDRNLIISGLGLSAVLQSPVFDLQAGTVSTSSGTSILKSARIEDVGDGWYRCSMVVVPATSGSISLGLTTGTTTTGAVPSYVGYPGKGLFLWGAQLVSPLSTTSITGYIKTTGSAVQVLPTRTDPLETITLDFDKLRRETVQLADRDFLRVARPRTDAVLITDTNPTKLTGVRKTDVIRVSRTDYSSYTTSAGNLLRWSEEFQQGSVWTTGNATIAANVSSAATLAPDGSATADKLRETGAGVINHLVFYSGLGAGRANIRQTFSVYAKAAERSIIALQLFNQVAFGATIYADLSSGTILAAGASGEYTSLTSTIRPEGSGWYRISISALKGATTSLSSIPLVYMASGNTASYNFTYAATTGVGVYLWGAQLNTSATLYAYTRTTAAARVVTAYANNLTERDVARDYETVKFDVSASKLETQIITDAQIFEFAARRLVRDSLSIPDSIYIVPGKVLYPVDLITVTDQSTRRSIVLGKQETLLIDERPFQFFSKRVSAPNSYTNLLIRSEELQTAGIWATSNATVIANVSSAATLAPDGTATAEKLRETTTNAQHFINYGALGTTTSDITRNFSIYAKAAERSVIYLQLANFSTGSALAFFNLSSGTVTLTADTPPFSNTQATITNEGSGWYRCSISANRSATSVNVSSVPVVGLVSGTTSTVYVGVATNGVYLWGAQLTPGTQLFDYLRTTSATRTAFLDSTSQSVTVTDREGWLLTRPRAHSVTVTDTQVRPLPNLRKFETLTTTDRIVGKDVTLRVPLFEYSTSIVQNLVTRSEELNTSWTITGGLVSANDTSAAALAPDSTVTADRFYENTVDRVARNYSKSLSVTTGVSHVYSVYAKNAGRQFLQIAPNAGFRTTGWVNYDLNTGTYSIQGTSTAIGAGVESVGNGWRRVWISTSATATTASATMLVGIAVSSGSTRTPGYLGVVGSGVYIWGNQFNTSVLRTYVQTTSAIISVSALVTTPINSVTMVEDIDIRITRISRAFDDDFTLTDAYSVRPNPGVLDSILVTDSTKYITGYGRSPTDSQSLDDAAAKLVGITVDLVPGPKTENQLRWSEALETAGVWTTSNAFIAANVSSAATLAPDGTATAEKLRENGANALHFVNYNVLGPGTANTTQTFSIYAKAAERSRVYLQLTNQVAFVAQALFDLSSGTIVAGGTIGNGEYTSVTSTITSAGSGWYRISLSALKGSTTSLSSVPVVFTVSGVATVTYTGVTGNGVYLWGAQLNSQLEPFPYTRTTSATVAFRQTRLRDNDITLTDRTADAMIKGRTETILSTDALTRKDVAQRKTETFLLSDAAVKAVAKLETDAFNIGSTATQPTRQPRENRLIRSEELQTAGVWTTSNVFIAANVSSAATLAPDATASAEKLRENGANATHNISYSVLGPGTANTTQTFSIYAKAAERNRVRIQFSNIIAFGAWSVFDLNSGTIVETSSNGEYINTTSTISSAGSGWYRISVSALKGATTSLSSVPQVLLITGNTTTFTYTGVTGNGVYLWGAQLNTSASVYPYTRTTSAIITTGFYDFPEPKSTLEVRSLSWAGSQTENVTASDSLSSLTIAYRRSNNETVNVDESRFLSITKPGIAEQQTIQERNFNLVNLSINLVPGPKTENQLRWSEEFQQGSVWTTGAATILANVSSGATLAPDSTATADKLRETGGTGTHFVRYDGLGTSSTGIQQTFSVYAKQAERRIASIQLNNRVSHTATVFVDLSSGTILASAGSGEYINVTSTIASAGSGWYRISVSAFKDSTTSLSSVPVVYAVSGTAASYTATYAATTGSGIYIWGAQLNSTLDVFDYTRTTSTAVAFSQTRLRDNNFSLTDVSNNQFNKVRTESIVQSDDQSFRITKSGIANDVTPDDLLRRSTATRRSVSSASVLIGSQETQPVTLNYQNLATYSEQFEVPGSWTTGNTRISSNTVTAPDGTLTGDSLTEIATTTNHQIISVQTLSSGVTYNVSLYARALTAGRNLQFSGLGIGGAIQVPTFNLAAGTVATSSGTSVVRSATIQSAGSGWYRCSMVVVPSATGAFTFLLTTSTAAGVVGNYLGVTGSGIYIWGAQVSTGSTLIAYTRTTSAGISQTLEFIEPKSTLEIRSLQISKRHNRTISLADTDKLDVEKQILGRPADINIVSSQGTVVYVSSAYYALEDYFAEDYCEGTRSSQTFN